MILMCYLAAHVYMREKAVASFVAALVVFHGRIALLSAKDTGAHPFVFQRFCEPIGVIAAISE